MQWANRAASLVIAVAAISRLIVPSLAGATCPAGKVCNQFVDESKGVNYLLVGNPGTGKSTILNGFAGKALFKSGPAFGKGKTKVLQKETVGLNTFMDTPGLADIKMREQAAQEITSALMAGGAYKIFFVITLEAGRVRPADRTTMELVLASAPITHYGVIINKLEKVEKEMLMSNTDGARDEVLAGLMNGMPVQSLYFDFELRKDSLAAVTDAVPSLDQELIQFIQQVPAVEIKPEEVKAIQTNEFDALSQKFEIMINELKADKQMLHKKMDEDRASYEKLIKDMQERQDKLMEKFSQQQSSGGGVGDILNGLGGLLGPLVPAITGAIKAFAR
jgi:GTP-binding protein EngB required for normal cell division